MILSQFNPGVDFNNLNFGQYPPLFFVCGILGSYSAIGFLKWIEENNIQLHDLNFLGVNSLFVMCTHLPLYVVVVVTHAVNKIFYVDYIGIVYYAWLLICMFWVQVIELVMLKIWKYVKHNTNGTYKFIEYL